MFSYASFQTQGIRRKVSDVADSLFVHIRFLYGGPMLKLTARIRYWKLETTKMISDS